MDKDDTIKLLQECDKGSKMAVSSIDDVIDRVEDKYLKEQLEKSKDHHEKIGNTIHKMLLERESDDKDPNIIAKGMSVLKTNIKIGLDSNNSTIADLMVDGCNMGIKSLHRYLNQYKKSSKEAKNICLELIEIEQELVKNIFDFL